MKTPKIDPREKRIVSRLRRESSFSDRLIGTGYFFAIAQWSLGYPGVFAGFDLDDLTHSLRILIVANYWFLVEQWPGIILAFALYLWFWSYRTHTSNEIDILEGIYPEGQSPTDWDRITNRRLVRFLAIGLVVVFTILAALLQHPALFTLIMIGLSCQDLLGNEILRENLRRIFAEFDCKLPEDDPRCQLHAGRQLAARRYWLERPQLLRIAGMMAATAMVLAVTLLPILFPDELAQVGLTKARIDIIATLALALIIVANEYVMRNWRRVRDDELLQLEIVFAEAQAARTAQAAASQASSVEIGTPVDGDAPGTGDQATPR